MIKFEVVILAFVRVVRGSLFEFLVGLIGHGMSTSTLPTQGITQTSSMEGVGSFIISKITEFHCQNCSFPLQGSIK